jgi:hypothetical protein
LLTPKSKTSSFLLEFQKVFYVGEDHVHLQS